jgi:hypothetical protein
MKIRVELADGAEKIVVEAEGGPEILKQSLRPMDKLMTAGRKAGLAVSLQLDDAAWRALQMNIRESLARMRAKEVRQLTA